MCVCGGGGWRYQWREGLNIFGSVMELDDMGGGVELKQTYQAYCCI